MPEWAMKEFANDVTDTGDEPLDSEVVGFNTKGSLKARLYCKNKKLMENVFNEKKESQTPRDSLVSLLDKSIS